MGNAFKRNDPPSEPLIFIKDKAASLPVYQINDLIVSLGTLASESESDFLMIGDRLHHFSAMARSIATQGTETAAFLTGDEMMAAIEQLQVFLTRINRYLNHTVDETRTQTQQLNSIYGVLHSIEEPLAGFNKLVKHLSILSLTIRIENARIQTGQQAFAHLVSDVVNLGEAIRQKTQLMRRKIRSIAESGRAEFQEIQRLEQQINERTTLILANISDQLSRLVNERQRASERSVLVADRVEAIGVEINQMIQSLQFHDIVRQRVEHVCEVLSEMAAAYVEQPNNEDCSGQAACIRLQVIQLNESKESVTDAMRQIRESLLRIDHYATEILEISQGNLSHNSGGQETSLIAVRSGIESVIDALHETVKGGFELRKLVSGIVGMVKEAGTFVNDIYYIGSEIELVAQNGIVHAAHLGDAGNALSVLADEIQRLSVNSHVQIDSVAGKLKTINAHTHKIAGSGADDADKKASLHVVGTMGQELFQLVQTLESVNIQVLERLGNVDVISRDFHAGLSELSGDIQVDRQLSSGLLNAIDALTAMADALSPSTEDAAMPDRAAMMLMAARYTMDSERETHQAFLGKETSTTTAQHLRSEPVVAAEDDSMFDANIELF